MAGVSCESFWNMSLNEIADTVRAADRSRHERMQQRAAFDYVLAKLISFAVNDPKHFPHRGEVYGNLFRLNGEREDWRIIKAQMSAVAKHNNAKKRGDVD